jgi:ligand-binding sensor domain-containing protein
MFVNALLATPRHLFVGTSEGLFRSSNGFDFERVQIVEDAVVGLSTDGTSVWASTPGALYRIKDGKDGKGPASDVWWMPGGSRSLQKVDARAGAVWIGTEDRGAVLMTPGPRTMAKDKPFSVFDKSSGLSSSWSLAVAPLPAGGALMTTLREGTYLIDQGGTATALSLPVGGWGLSTLVEDDSAWIGTQDGAAHLDLKTLSATRIRDLPDERVHAFLRDPRHPERLYVGTEAGLAWCETNPSSEPHRAN